MSVRGSVSDWQLWYLRGSIALTLHYMCTEQRSRQVQKLKIMSNNSLIKQEMAVSCRVSAGAIPSLAAKGGGSYWSRGGSYWSQGGGTWLFTWCATEKLSVTDPSSVM